MELTKDIIDALVKYNELNKEYKRIEKELGELKPTIVNFIKDELKGEPLEYGNIRAVLSTGNKKTIVGESVEKIFNIQLTDECFKVSTYPMLKVTEAK